METPVVNDLAVSVFLVRIIAMVVPSSLKKDPGSILPNASLGWNPTFL